jgi:1,4-alpha-glucan branching enzyme
MAVRKEKKGEVTFIFDQKPAKSVYVAGDFNKWDPKANRMTKVKDGTFRARVTLSPGKHQYKYVADGSWIEDEEADGNEVNEFGTSNSVVLV